MTLGLAMSSQTWHQEHNQFKILIFWFFPEYFFSVDHF